MHLMPILSKQGKLLHKPRDGALSLKLKLGMTNVSFYIHASKTQEFNHKMNVIRIKL
jgi:hypothetical protein